MVNVCDLVSDISLRWGMDLICLLKIAIRLLLVVGRCGRILLLPARLKWCSSVILGAPDVVYPSSFAVGPEEGLESDTEIVFVQRSFTLVAFSFEKSTWLPKE